MTGFKRTGIGALLLCAACAAEPPFGPHSTPLYARATQSCGLAGGSAVAVYLTHEPVTELEPAAPFYRIHVWRSLERASGTWEVGAGSHDAAAIHHSDGGIEVATGGTVRIDPVSPTKAFSGQVDVTFPDGERLQSVFYASWLPTETFCM